jgi:hypothetical protein
MKHMLKHRFKPGPMALGLGLMLTTLCFGQASYEGPPHNVIYWDGYTGDGSLQTLVYSNYTDVIVDFVVPDQNCNLSSSGPNGDLPDDIVSSIQTLHNAGKTVLVSFGGGGIDSGNYAACNVGPEPVLPLANQLTEIVKNNGFDGADIDFEDTNAFKSQAGYDGVSFLTSLTEILHSLLPQWSIITHAPQTPYWLQNYSYNAPPYALINSKTSGEIAWFNTQTYNQCGDTDCTAAAKIYDYEYIVRNFLGAPIKLVMGLPVSYCGTTDNQGNCTGDGYIPINGDPGNDVQTVITKLEQEYPNRFGGVMGWNYSLDLRDDGGSWGSDVAGGLFAFQPNNWAGFSDHTGLCLDNNNGAVYTDTCHGGKWRFYVPGQRLRRERLYG